VRAHLTTPPPTPSARHDGIPTGLDAVVARAMAKDAAERFARTGDLVDAAVRALAPPAPPAVPEPAPTAVDATFVPHRPRPATPAPAATDATWIPARRPTATNATFVPRRRPQADGTR
jgi:serine/threonine-protein kinase